MDSCVNVPNFGLIFSKREELESALTLTMGEPMEGKIWRRCPRVIKVWQRGGDVFRSVNGGDG